MFLYNMCVSELAAYQIGVNLLKCFVLSVGDIFRCISRVQPFLGAEKGL